jgi:CBS domain-containing protein
MAHAAWRQTPPEEVIMENVIVVPAQVRSAASLIERTAANNDVYLESSDSAFSGLTDFRREYLITVEADSSIDAALDDMNRLGVHALLVTRQEVESMEQQVVGLITYYDIERSRPHRLSGEAAAEPRAICVSDVMTPWNELPLVRYESLQSLTAFEVYEMFQGTGLTHLLVIETDHDGSVLARGLLSRATLAKRLSRPPAIVAR